QEPLRRAGAPEARNRALAARMGGTPMPRALASLRTSCFGRRARAMVPVAGSEDDSHAVDPCHAEATVMECVAR
ncbi:MAG: hypothetical protein RLZZ127_1759, partial [Planctomycetota bacterium]